MEEIIYIDGRSYRVEYDQTLTLNQTIYLIDEIKNIFGTENIRTNEIQISSLSPKIEILATPKQPPVFENLSNYYYDSGQVYSLHYLGDDISISKNISKKTSIILPVRNEGKLILDTINSILNNQTNIPYEVIVVDDGSTDGCCNIIRQNLNEGKFDKNKIKLITNISSLGACKTRNLGADSSSPDSNYLCFLDAHIRVEPYMLEKLIEAELSSLGNNQAIVTGGICVLDESKCNINPACCLDDGGFGETLNLSELPRNNFVPLWLAKPKNITEVPFAPGGLMFMPKSLFKDIGGFDTIFQTWGAEDTEISIKAHLFGYKILATPETRVSHFFRPKHPYSVGQFQVDFNNIIMAISHFSQERIEKMLALMKARTNIEKIMSFVLTSDVFEQRKRYLTKRRYDDDWFFKKFNITF